MWLRLAVWLALGAALGGCIDPGCIRNSECGPRYRCLEGACVLRPADGGLSGPIVEEDAGAP